MCRVVNNTMPDFQRGQVIEVTADTIGNINELAAVFSLAATEKANNQTTKGNQNHD
jgi:hypothetical protein